MFQAGITGGMGSGKSTIAEIFKVLGVPVLKSDDVARALMESNQELQDKIIKVFGKETYKNGRLNRPFLATIVFQNPEKLKQLNGLVHPAVLDYSEHWAKTQTSAYVLRESALFFETGSNTQMDFMIGVWAPKEKRIQRVLKRNSWTREEIENRMSQQMAEEEKMNRCEVIIKNDGTESIIVQTVAVNKKILNLINKQNQDGGFKR